MKSERDCEAQEFRARGAEVSLRIRSRADRDKTVLEAEKTSQKLRGEGDGERNRVFASAFGGDPEFFSFYRSMLAHQSALGDEQTTMVLSPDSEFFCYLADVSGSVRAR